MKVLLHGLLLAQLLVLSVSGGQSFTLVGKNASARVCVAAGEPEFVQLAATDLTNDVFKITHAVVPVLVGETPRPGDVLVKTVPDGRWEAYAATVRDGVLELTGSDARGTMFAVYDFCERRLGVDPLWFWSGVAHPRAKTLAWDDVAFAQGSPTVRFRGWFVNDEDMLTKWMPASGMRDYMDYPYYSNVVSHVAMEAVAEAMVRTRMNFTIPASFLNIMRPAEAGIAAVCARRGLYVSMHHIEPMGVSGFAFKDYWRKRGRDLVYSYFRHPAEVEEVWRAFAAEWAKLPNVIWQIGLRGTGDRAAWQDDPTMPKDDAGRAAIINRAMARQVEILDELGVPKETRRVTTTLWGEGTYFNEKGLLKIPAGTTVVFADNNCGWKWGEDLVSARREPDRLTYGTYYHHQLILAGPHLVTLIPASKTCTMLREAMAHGASEYAVFNVGNVREFIYGLGATAKMTWHLPTFDPTTWERDWLARRVPSAAADWQAARRAYFAALVENPANGIPCFLDGRMRCRVYEKNWAMQAILDGKAPRQRVEKPKAKTKDPFLSKIGQCVLRDVTPMEAYALLETQRVAYAEAAALARKAMAATAKGDRAFANDHLLYPAELMLGFSEAYGAIILAEEALRESRDADCLRRLEAAEASLVRVVALGKGYCHGPWKTWYVGCEKVSPREMLRLTRETMARLRKTLPPDLSPAKIVEVTSSADATRQKCWFYSPEKTEAVPLLVGLHTWSGDYRSVRAYRPGLDEAVARGWAFVGPDFRGPNSTPAACGSDLAVQDIVDAVDYAKAHAKVDASRIYIMGGSGGGHMTLLMLGRHPEIFAAGAAFCPITDLARWHADSLLDHPGRGKGYAKMMEGACGGTPSERPDEYRQRSPLAWLERARTAQVPVYVGTGIHDGWRGSVPVGHAIRAYNALADAADRISEEDIAAIEANQALPPALAPGDVADPFYGPGAVHLRRTSGNVRLTLFEGGHSGNYPAGADFLSRQCKDAKADWSLPATAAASVSGLER